MPDPGHPGAHAYSVSTSHKLLSPAQLAEIVADIRGAHLSEILGAAETIKIGPQQIILREGAPPTQMFLLRSGRAEFFRLSRAGDKVLLSLLVPGDAFGLGTLLAPPVPYIGTAKTIRDSELLVWKQARIRKLAQKYPRLAQNALGIVLRYLTEHFDRLFELVTSTAGERVAAALLHLAKETGRRSPTGFAIDASNEELAAQANVSPFTVSRHLSRWESTGALSKSRGKVFIRNPEKLLDE
jgi:CRP-like cAMP-binding protein